MTITLKRDAFKNGEMGVCERALIDYRASEFLNLPDLEEDLRAIMDFQMEDGSFSLASDYRMDSDCRVFYVYRPTYICCQILIKAILAGKAPEGALESLAKGLDFSCGRNLAGHGFDSEQQQVEDVIGFLDAGVLSLFSAHPGISDEFEQMIEGLLDSFEDRVSSANVFLSWGVDASDAFVRALVLAEREVRFPVFVYGTLLKGCCNHGLLEDACYLGEAKVEGLAVYDLGAYPGARFEQGCSALGEVYEVDAETLRRLNILEGKGSLYDLDRVKCDFENGICFAGVYVYRGSVEEVNLIPSELQPWSVYDGVKDDCVWYACYGSNMLKERFDCYIKGGSCRFNGRYYPACVDSSDPKAEVCTSIPHPLYFGNSSGSWGGCGVAFVDPTVEGHTPARAYLITRQQYEHVRDLECRASSWYPDEIDLGAIGGIPVKTFTNISRRPENAPSEAYLDVMRAGYLEAFHPEVKRSIDCALATAMGN